MFALVEAAAVEREADRLHDLHRQRAACAALNLPTMGSTGRCSWRASTSRISPGRRRASALNIASISRRGEPRAELIDQRVVRREIARLAEQLRLVAHQVNHFFEVRREVFELAGLARVQPLRFGLGRSLGQARDQRHRRRDREVALPAHLAQVRDLPVLEAAGAGLRAIEQARDPRRGDQRVVLGLQRRELFAANVGAAARHHHRRVPPQDGHGTAEGMQAFPFLLELFVRGLGHGGSLEREDGRAPVYQRPSFRPLRRRPESHHGSKT